MRGSSTASQKVVAAARAELAGVGRDAASVERLLGKVDLLLGRAITEDGMPERRGQSSDRVRAVLGDEALPPGDDLLERTSLAELASRVLEAGASQPTLGTDGLERLHALLGIYISTDIPDALEVRGSADGEGDASVNTLGAVEPASLSVDEVAGYLRRRVGEGIRVTEVSRLAGGFGKETILVCTEGRGGLGEIVLRKVVPGRPVDILAPEYGMVQFAWKNGLPVPEPLWIETDPAALGSPFFVTTRAAGRNTGDVYGPYPGVSPKIALDVAGIVARLHLLNVDELGLTPTVSMYTSSQVLDAIADQDKLLLDVARADDLYGPLWRAVLAWLRSHLPEPGRQPVLVHADVGFHNLLNSDTRVEALLDWERSHLGTVAQDLAYIKPSITNLLPWEEFLQAYREAGGTDPDERSIQFYTVWQDTWRGIASLRLRQRFLSEAIPRLADGVAGILMAPRFLLTAVQNAFEIDLPGPGQSLGRPEWD